MKAAVLLQVACGAGFVLAFVGITNWQLPVLTLVATALYAIAYDQGYNDSE